MLFYSRKIILLVLFFLFRFSAFSQTGFAVGYNMGFFPQPQRNIQVLTYEFNHAHPNYDQKYNFGNVYQGFAFSFCKKAESKSMDIGMELMFSNRHIITTAEGADNPGDTIFRRQVKMRMNTLGFGYYGQAGPLKAGFDFDLGLCQFYKKIAPKDSFKDESWKPIYNRPGFLTCGITFFFEIRLGIPDKLGDIKIRPYYQMQMLPVKTKSGNLYALTQKYHEFSLSNFGLAVYIGLEGKGD